MNLDAIYQQLLGALGGAAAYPGGMGGAQQQQKAEAMAAPWARGVNAWPRVAVAVPRCSYCGTKLPKRDDHGACMKCGGPED